MGTGTHPVSDGCTGFWWAEEAFDGVRECCVDHDMGGTDGTLLDCLLVILPMWAWAPAAFCVALMILFRPVYHRIKRIGKWQ